MTPKTARQRGAYLTIYSLGFYLAMTTKSWWALLNSIITIIVLWAIFAGARKIGKIYNIPVDAEKEKWLGKITIQKNEK
jgi:hypothetical protein